MPIAVFENARDDVVLTFRIDPWDDERAVPPLAKLGVRYADLPVARGYAFTSLSKHTVSIWCDDPHYEVEIVHPTPYDRLLHDICVNGGFCGGAFENDAPVRLSDLLPAEGSVTAGQFVDCVFRRESGGARSEAQAVRWRARLEARFIHHMGADVVPASALIQNLRNPFEDAD